MLFLCHISKEKFFDEIICYQKNQQEKKENLMEKNSKKVVNMHNENATTAQIPFNSPHTWLPFSMVISRWQNHLSYRFSSYVKRNSLSTTQIKFLDFTFFDLWHEINSHIGFIEHSHRCHWYSLYFKQWMKIQLH